jgi:hypothetical protein
MVAEIYILFQQGWLLQMFHPNMPIVLFQVDANRIACLTNVDLTLTYGRFCLLPVSSDPGLPSVAGGHPVISSAVRQAVWSYAAC